MLKLINVKKIYSSAFSVGLGLDSTNLSFDNGEFVAVTGPSGSGKTTLVNIISGLDNYTEGEMEFLGEKTSYYSKKDFENYTNENIGFVFQQYNLIEDLTVQENLRQALIFSGFKGDIETEISTLLEKVDISSKMYNRASTLSGGEKQRLVIAKALAKNSRIIVADEPTANLDEKNGTQIINLLHELSKDRLILIVTHNYEEVADFVTRKIELKDGKVVKDTKVNTQNDPTDVKDISIFKGLNLLESINIGFKFFTSNLSRVALQLIMITILTAIITLYALLVFNISNRESYWASDMNPSPDRLVVLNQDKGYVSQDDIEQLEQIEGISVIKNDSFLYNSYPIWIDSYFSRYQFINSEEVIVEGFYESTKITGKTSNLGKYEVIAYTSQSYEGEDNVKIGDKLTAYLYTYVDEDYGYNSYTVELDVVGTYSGDSSALIVSKDLITEIDNSMNYLSSFESVSVMDTNVYTSSRFGYDETLTGNEVTISDDYVNAICYENITDYDVLTYSIDMVNSCKDYITNNIDDFNLRINYLKSSDLDIALEYTIKYDLDNLTTNVIDNSDEYNVSTIDVVVNFSKEVFDNLYYINNTQVSVFVDDISKLQDVKDTINAMGLMAVDYDDYEFATTEVWPLSERVILFIIKLIPVAIVATVFGVFMNLLFNRKTQTLVLTRSLGARKSDLFKIQMFEYTIISAISVIAVFIIYTLVNGKYRVFTVEGFGFAKFLGVFLVVLLALAIIVLITIRNIYKQTIYSQLKRNN